MTAADHHEALLGRIRAALNGQPGLSEQRKMGGTTFLIDGKVCVRAHGEELMVRCRPGRTDELLLKPGVRRFEMRGKPAMKGWLLVSPPGFEHEGDFAVWIETSLQACAEARPAKARG